MKFTPFDLDYQITRHNLTEGTALKRNDFDFLRVLAPESICAFKSSLDLFKHSTRLGAESFTSKEALFLDTVIKQLCDKDYQEAHFSVYQPGEPPQKNNQSNLHYEQQQLLKNSEFWSEILSNPNFLRNKDRLLPLKNQWLSNVTHYASHNLDALWFVSNNIADFFENYYKIAIAEYQKFRRKIPKTIASDYKDYLENEMKKVIEFRTELSQIMLLKLQLASAQNDVTYGDLIHYTTLLLHNNELSVQEFGPQSRKHELSPKYFQSFLGYILRYGNETQQQSLSNLSLFQCDNEYIAWRNKKAILLVPVSFYNRKLVPESEPWFPSLFPNRHFRYQFIEKNVWLFSSIRFLSKHPIEINRLNEILSHLQSIEKKLEEANTEIEERKFNVIQKFIHYSTVLFTLEWSGFFVESKINVAIKKISILEKIYNHYKKPSQKTPDFSIIENLISEISRFISDNTLPTEECEKFHVIKSKLLECKKTTALTTSKKTDDLTDSRLSTNPFGDKKTVQPPLKPAPPTNPFDTPILAPHPVDSSLFDLITKIKLMEIDKENFEEMIDGISNTMMSLQNEISSINHQTLESANKELFGQLIKYCTSLNSQTEYERFHNKFIAVEQLLLKYSPEYITSRITDLIAIREKKHFWFLYQIKCKSYIASFENEKITFASNLIANSALFNSQPAIQHDEPSAPHETLTQ